MISKLFYRLLPYQILLIVINAANIIVDSLFSSNYIGTAGMSAIGIYAPFDHLLYAVSMILVSGSQLLIGKSMGKNHLKSINNIFSTDLIAAVFVSVLIAIVVVILAATGLTGLLINDDQCLQAINMYFYGMAPGIPALVLGQQLFSFLSMENQTRLTMAAGISCIAVNTLMDVLFVAVMKMGTFGLGIGSSVGLWAFFGIMAAYYISGRSDMKFSFRRFRKSYVGRIVKQGYPGALSRLLEMVRCVIVNILVVNFVGALGLSAFAAVNSVMAVFWAFPFGLVAVNRMLMGVSVGEEDRTTMVEIMRAAVVKGTIIQCAITAVLCLLAVPLTGLFYHEPSYAVYQMTEAGFRILPLCMPFSVLSLVFVSYAQAIDKKFLAHVLPILDGLANVALFAAILIPSMKMNGLYLANILNGIVCTIVIIAVSAKKRRHFPKNMEDLMDMPDDFGVGPDSRVDIELNDLSSVVGIAKQVVAFCKGQGIDLRRSILSGVALEEMAGNVVEHGFIKDRKKHSIAIRVAYKKERDEVILRIRDNCIPFNPAKRLEIADPTDRAKNIGIRMIYGMAKDVNYQNIFGLNVLTIHI